MTSGGTYRSSSGGLERLRDIIRLGFVENNTNNVADWQTCKAVETIPGEIQLILLHQGVPALPEVFHRIHQSSVAVKDKSLD